MPDPVTNPSSQPRIGRKEQMAIFSSPKPTRAMVAALMEMKPNERGGRMLDIADLADTPSKWNREMELRRTKRLAKEIIKKPPPPTPAAAGDDVPQAAPDFEALPSGTRLRVWWEGSCDYFECIILNWRVAIGEDGDLFYTHRCQYDGGIFDHDLSKASFEVIDVAHAWTLGIDDPDAGDDDDDGCDSTEYGTNLDDQPLTARRRCTRTQTCVDIAHTSALRHSSLLFSLIGG